MQHLPQRLIAGQSDIGQSLIKAGDCAAIHLNVFSIPAVHFDDDGLVTVEIRICGRATEGLSPVSGESLDMLGVETMAKGVGDNLVGHYSMMPGVCKTE